jgi:hypothetical protein
LSRKKWLFLVVLGWRLSEWQTLCEEEFSSQEKISDEKFFSNDTQKKNYDVGGVT